MKKTVYTLSINDYAPEITKLTIPLMKRWAKKIGADFHIITERKFPDFPIPYEKFQIKELAAKNGDEWSIFWDADALIHPDFWDPTEVVGKDTTVSNGSDFMPIRFKPDKYFKRDGRFIGKGNWCMMASDWCTDIWSPLEDLTKDEAAARITPTLAEEATIIEGEHLIDDFTVSRNISRFGLKHILIPELSEKLKVKSLYNSYLWHQYLINIDQKIFTMQKQIMLWVADALTQGEPYVPGVTTDNPILDGKKILETLEFNKDKAVDWQELLSVIPSGKRIAKTIKSWGIDINIVKPEDVGWEAKKRMMGGALSILPDCKEKQRAFNAINTWKGETDWSDLLSALEVGQVIATFIKDKFGATIKITPLDKFKTKEATKHAPLG